MDIHDRIRTVFPHAPASEIDRWIAGGRDYAAKLDLLPVQEREAVCQLFACYGLTTEDHYRRAMRRAIDVTIRAFYPAAGVEHANA